MTELTLAECAEIQAIADELESDTELTEEAKAEIARQVEASLAKPDRLARYMDFLAARIASQVAEIKSLEGLRESKLINERKLERLKGFVLYIMERQGRDKINGLTRDLVKQQNSSFSLSIIDESKIPAHYKVIQETVDREKLKKDLAAGIAVPGAELKRGFHLRVKG